MSVGYIPRLCSFNRTNKELKSGSIWRANASVRAFNRTNKELKYIIARMKKEYGIAFNRTNKELKFFKI